jgi:hypothetical protein
MPDATRESFEPSTGHGGHDGADGRAVRYLEWARPGADEGRCSTDYVFVTRDVAGLTQVVHETHHHGLFGRADWLRLLVEAGFEADALTEETAEDRAPREVFVGRRVLG